MTQPVFTPYTTVKPFLGSAKPYLPELDSDRVLSYEFYDRLYWNVTATLQVVARGTNALPIYIPAARTIIETIDRYAGAQFGWEVLPGTAPDAEAAAATLNFNTLFARERFLSKFDSNKICGLRRGDWAWHIIGNGDKLPGTRIDIRAVDPGTLRKITHPNDVERLLGWDIFEEFDDNGTVKLKVQRYSKVPDPVADPDADDTGLIYSALYVFTFDGYLDEINKGPEQVLAPVVTLPPQITQLPIYHIPNVEDVGDPYGASELRGFETVLGAINQSVSDEDLALALEGLGVYATTSGPPRDRTTGRPTTWKLGPGRVAEVAAGTNLWRVNGVGNLGPYQDHMSFMLNSVKEASGATDAATGKVDVNVAESGVSLLFQLGPILAKAAKKDRIMADSHAQMFFDLARGWFPAYEQVNLPTVQVMPTFGAKLPINKAGEVDTLLKVVAVAPALIPWAIRQMQKLGFDFTPEEIALAAAAPATADPFADRVQSEVDAGGNEDAAVAAE